MKVDVALVHYPVCNKNKEVIGSAVTNLDLHDIARASCTFGVDTFYVVTPFADQKSLVGEIITHWKSGYGAAYNPFRKEAFSLIELIDDVESLFTVTEKKWGKRPKVLATCARELPTTVSYPEIKSFIQKDEPLLLLFGTASGMSAELFDQVDAVLPPLLGVGAYNHLSVRSAVSIILDRLLGRE